MEFVQLEPPAYPSPFRSPGRPPRTTCHYCSTSHDEDCYKEHLITAHSDNLFHCEECDKYIDKKDFLLHMSFHAEQYGKKHSDHIDDSKIKKNDCENIDKREIIEVEIALKSEIAVSPKISPQPLAPVVPMQTTPDTTTRQIESTKLHENEFSDHSDMEYGFGPLPESVFEAIEDSQDSQRLEEDQTLENEHIIAESPESIDQVTSIQTPENNETIKTPEYGHTSDESLKSDTSEENSEVTMSDLENPENIETQKEQQIARKARTCQICSKVYTAASSYFYHMKYSHQVIKKFSCDICKAKFGTKASLKQHHAAIHTRQFEYECKQCNKAFRSKASQYIHEQTHNDIKTWSCPQCHKAFRWKTHMLRHLKRHAAEKAHVCELCGRGFNIHCDLLRHARTHTAGNYTCEKCGLKFAQLRYLKVHTVKKHSTKVLSESQ